MKKQILAFLLAFLVLAVFTACEKLNAEGSASHKGHSVPDGLDVPSCLIDEITRSYSATKFKEGAVSDDALEAILQSGQKAPSAANGQPWHFTVIKGAGISPQVAPRHYAEGAAVIVVSGKTNARFAPAFDCALAAQNIYLAAQSLGLGARMYYTGVQDINDNQKKSLGIPDDYDVQIIILVGYLDDDADAVSSASPRRPLSENVNYID